MTQSPGPCASDASRSESDCLRDDWGFACMVQSRSIQAYRQQSRDRAPKIGTILIARL